MGLNQSINQQRAEESDSLYTQMAELEPVVDAYKTTKHADQASEELSREIFNHSKDAVFLIHPLEDRIFDVNPSACHMLGFSRDELLSLPISAIHPNEMSHFLGFTESVFEQGHGFTDELTCRTKSGEFLTVEISASVLKIGEKECILSLARDITARKQAEDTLAQLASFPIQNPNPVIEADLHGHVTYCNPAADELFPDLRAEGHNHPILSGVKPIIIACQTQAHEGITREIRVGEAVYEQKICCVPKSDLIRIFIYDLTARVRAEALEHENAYLREAMKAELAFGEIVGQNPALRNMLQQIELVAPTDASVLIQGESGTGKELIARAIHTHSQRSGKTMVKVNCGAIPRELFESEFFGHVKGAFTGALKERKGRFELADGGTLFLDEVSEIPLELQSKLLRVLQEGQFERVGDDRTREVDVRIISATNRDLKAEIEAKRFREDLFFRLSVFPITVPPLRERMEDIPLLAEHFIKTVCARFHRRRAKLTPADIRHLYGYDWPGNVRELQNVIERAVILSGDGPLRLDLALPGAETAKHETPQSGGQRKPDSRFVTDSELKRRERENTIAALEAANWKVFGQGGAAELLDVKPTTLMTRIKKMEIEKPR